jgi:hypothetical protein
MLAEFRADNRASAGCRDDVRFGTYSDVFTAAENISNCENNQDVVFSISELGFCHPPPVGIASNSGATDAREMSSAPRKPTGPLDGIDFKGTAAVYPATFDGSGTTTSVLPRDFRGVCHRSGQTVYDHDDAMANTTPGRQILRRQKLRRAKSPPWIHSNP